MWALRATWKPGNKAQQAGRVVYKSFLFPVFPGLWVSPPETVLAHILRKLGFFSSGSSSWGKGLRVFGKELWVARNPVSARLILLTNYNSIFWGVASHVRTPLDIRRDHLGHRVRSFKMAFGFQVHSSSPLSSKWIFMVCCHFWNVT